jgi:hypothetical protein
MALQGPPASEYGWSTGEPTTFRAGWATGNDLLINTAHILDAQEYPAHQFGDSA